MTASTRLRIMVLIQGEVGERIAGPAVRGWEMSCVLAARHSVTALAPNVRRERRDGVQLVPFSRRSVLTEALRHDVVIAPELPPYLLAALQGRRTLLVADQFGPVELEQATLGDGSLVARQVETQRAMRLLQLRFADVIVSANESQRERLLAQLEGVRDDLPRLVTVPFGLPDPPPRSSANPIRNAFPAIRDEDFVILWWGSIWRWLDADTALRAFARMAACRRHVKFVLPAGRAPSAGAGIFDAAEEARALAAELGLLGRSVFFLEDWISYEDRHAWLQDADLGLVLHRDTPEAKIAARSRYLDYLWCGVPCVLARGDDVARRLGEAGFASLVPPLDVDAAAAAMFRLVDDRDTLGSARAAAPGLADEYRWPALVEPLVEEIEREVARPLPRVATGPGRAALASASYYRRRAGDLIARKWAAVA